MEILVENLQKKVLIKPQAIKLAANKALNHVNIKQNALSIVFVGSARMRRINRQFLNHDYVTDVITFHHGEIIICPQTAARNAKQYQNSVQNELALYVVHGILHLAGYKDKTPSEIAKMRAMEQRILQ